MGYDAVNRLPPGVGMRAVEQFVQRLGYKRVHDGGGRERKGFFWFEEKDYRSDFGVSLDIGRSEGLITVHTRTQIARGYWDALQHNTTIRELRLRFGGTFRSDSGANRLPPIPSHRPVPAEAGCTMAYSRFGTALIQLHMYLDHRVFNLHPSFVAVLPWVRDKDPRIVSNNLLLPFLVSMLEQYFKSCFMALLRYSDKKANALSDARLSKDHLAAIVDGAHTVESAVVEVMPFQRIDLIAKNFRRLDPGIDIEGVLRKPFRRRKQTLLESVQTLVSARHELVHRGYIDVSLDDARIVRLVEDLTASVERAHRHFTKRHNWKFTQRWGVARFKLKRVREGDRIVSVIDTPALTRADRNGGVIQHETK